LQGLSIDLEKIIRFFPAKCAALKITTEVVRVKIVFIYLQGRHLPLTVVSKENSTEHSLSLNSL